MAHDPNTYKRLELREHIYVRPGAHLGSDKHISRKERVLSGDKFEMESIDLPEACERMYGEILSNAGDNVQRSRLQGVDPGVIEISMDNEWVMVRNGGLVVPVVANEKEKIYTPEMVFGVLLTSSNYNDDINRTWGGCHGEGAKLCNIFSQRFVVKIGDPDRGLSYIQTWEDNMRKRSEPIIGTFRGKGYVEVSYLMDFKRFGYNEYPAAAQRLFARRAADVSFSCGIPVIFNGKRLSCKDIAGYAAMCFPLTHYFIHKEETPGCSVDLLVADAVDRGKAISFMNGIESPDGGVHVEGTYNKIRQGISERVDKPKKEGEKRKRLFAPKDLKAHVSIVISCRLYNPAAHNQSKTKAGEGKTSFRLTLPRAKINNMLQWPFLFRLRSLAEIREKGTLRKTDGKSRRNVNVARAEDANYAGDRKKSFQCSLFVIEGKSAMAWAAKLVSRLPEGRNYCGLFPMQGVPLNVTNANYKKIVGNKEISDLKLTLGLREGVDYTDDKEYRTLRYGHFVIMTDADDDGIHIRGLIINIFNRFWPGLLSRGFVKYLRTPIIKVSKGREIRKFYSMKEYLDWQEATTTNGWKTKYFKGLACSNNDDISDEVKDLHVIVCMYDDLAPNYLRLAFDKAFADKRKSWIEHHRMEVEKTPPPEQPISDFVNDDLVLHSITNILRSIPRLDGLKRSQRQILWASMEKWKKCKDPMKVGRLSHYVADFTAYHYGEKALIDAVNNMALEYAGSNNLPYFFQEGTFGTRNMEGKDVGQPRYVSVRPRWWWNLVFRPEDMGLCQPVMEEGEPREPKVFYPIMPLILINGANGIGTAWSTFVPNHNPEDICAWLRARITGETPPPLLPWYRYFEGTIEIRERKKKAPIVEEDHEDPCEDILGPDSLFEDNTAGWSMVVNGAYRTTDKGVVVTELPITRSIHKYDSWLKKQRENGDIRDFHNMSGEDKPHFTIMGIKDASLAKLRLQRSFGLGNITYIDDDDRPRRAKTTSDLMETWFLWRRPYYNKRKELTIENKTREMAVEDRKMRFIDAVRSGKIVVINRPKQEVYSAMDAMGFDRSLLKKTSLHGSLADSIERLKKKIALLAGDIEKIKATTPEQMWLSDLEEFMVSYRKFYG